MYLRIKNKFDLTLLTMEQEKVGIDSVILNRLAEIIETLDGAYGMCRNAHSMGGYVFLFTEINDYQKYRELISDYYGIDMKLCEYSDDLGNGWCEELYLLSSDDSIVMLYRKGGESDV